MLCFLDRTFCSQLDCVNHLCSKNYDKYKHFQQKDSFPIAVSGFRETVICQGYKSPNHEILIDEINNTKVEN